MYITNILDYLDLTAKRFPQRIGFCDIEQELDFGNLYHITCSIGQALCRMDHFRVPVAVVMSRGVDCIAAMLGVVRAGCFYAVFDPEMPQKRLTTLIEKFAPVAIICGDQDIDLDGIDCAKLQFSKIKNEPYDEKSIYEIRQRTLDTDPVYVVFTSGSTGEPKGVVTSHRSLIDYAEALCDSLGFNEGTIFGSLSPLYYDAPMKEILPALAQGGRVCIVPRSTFLFPSVLFSFFKKYRVNTLCWVSSAYVYLSLVGAFSGEYYEDIDTICFGSEVFPVKYYNEWRSAFPRATMYNLYGPTEATGMSCFWRAKRPIGEDESIPIGSPFPNTSVFLVDEQGNRAVGEGEICICGTCLALGYYREPAATDRAFVQIPRNASLPERTYRTGDIGRYNEYGELIFVGRRDTQIKHMGHRVDLCEIERIAVGCRNVDEVCCLYDASKKRIFCIYSGDAEQKYISRELAKCLPTHALPCMIHRNTLPHTSGGKIDRAELRKICLEE